jgi:RNA polymerase sigma factor
MSPYFALNIIYGVLDFFEGVQVTPSNKCGFAYIVVVVRADAPCGVTLYMDIAANQRLLYKIKKIQDGDQTVLEKLIDDYKPFILKITVQFCKRMLVWGHDDELSIGLIAFDTAVNTFDPDKEIPFPSYCRVVINNRLKDYARTQIKHHNVIQLDQTNLNIYLEGKLAQDDYVNKEIEEERRQELEHLESILADYSFGFEDLAEVSPKHRDTRQTMLDIARKLAESEELWSMLTNKKMLPLNELEKACGIKRKTLERGRKFIIASAVILHDAEHFRYLISYVDFS